MKFPLPQTILARIEGDHDRLAAALPLLAQLSGFAANYTPDNDGYPAGGSSGPRSSDTTSTTERAALAGCTSAEMERIIDGYLAGTTLLLDAAARLAAYVTPRPVNRGRVSTVDVCPACDKPMPRPRSGFCETDYRQWLREGRPDRAWFTRRRRTEHAEAAAREAEQAKAHKAGKGAA